MKLGLVRHHIYQEHDPGPFHCECPRRLEAADEALESWSGRESLLEIAPRPARQEELARVHQMSHIHRIAGTDGRSVGLDPDTSTSPQSYQAALMAAGGLLELCDAALNGAVQGGIALVRPPGHHATANRAMGFCLFNNVAVAAAHLVEQRGLERVLIVDWDVHHGNGTEDSFYESKRVLYFSTHQSPFYPGTGRVGSVGGGAGRGYTVNQPLPGGCGDSDYIRIFEDLLLPVARQYQPQFILVSAGFDAHAEDPLGGMRLSDLAYGALTRVLVEIAGDCCPGRVVLTLEGGYNPEAQARSILRCLEALAGDTAGDELRRQAAGAPRPQALERALEVQSQFWDL